MLKVEVQDLSLEENDIEQSGKRIEEEPFYWNDSDVFSDLNDEQFYKTF